MVVRIWLFPGDRGVIFVYVLRFFFLGGYFCSDIFQVPFIDTIPNGAFPFISSFFLQNNLAKSKFVSTALQGRPGQFVFFLCAGWECLGNEKFSATKNSVQTPWKTWETSGASRDGWSPKIGWYLPSPSDDRFLLNSCFANGLRTVNFPCFDKGKNVSMKLHYNGEMNHYVKWQVSCCDNDDINSLWYLVMTVLNMIIMTTQTHQNDDPGYDDIAWRWGLLVAFLACQIYPLKTNMTMENWPFEDVFPI